jgi:phenylacetic acid degradation operon negative regulatory protein
MHHRSADGDPAQPHMKPRALILDLFGDYLRYAGAEVRASDLVALLGVFGVEPAAVRMTLSRLRREHWFTTRRAGREVTYALSPHMLGVLQDGRERIFADYDEPWDLCWTTVVQQSVKNDRLVRDQLRRQLTWLGFGSLSPSTWLTPRDRRVAFESVRSEFPDVHFTMLRSRSEDLEVDRDIVARCWDVADMNRRYEDFLSENAPLAEATGVEGADALRARTAIIAAYRHFPFLDPWLPKELRPDGWLGTDANVLFRTVHRDLGAAATAFVADVVGRAIDGPTQ